jgi:predicted phage terminase large subunit-like protein
MSSLLTAETKTRLAQAIRAELARRQNDRDECGELEDDLAAFHRGAWPWIDPARYVHNWHIDAMAEHLEAVTWGHIRRLIICIPPRCMKPVAVDEFVMTARGRVRLAEIAVGDLVLTHLGRFRRVSAVHEQGELPTVEVRTWNGRRVCAAPDHPFLTADGWRNAGDLREGDALAAVVPQPLGAALDPREARLLGYLVGDGSTKHGAIVFTNADDDVLRDFELCAQHVGFAVRRTRKPGNRATSVALSSNRDGRLQRFLERHGLRGKSSYDKVVPDAVIRADVTAVGHFLGAYWSCDGYVGVRHDRGANRTTHIAKLTTVSEALAGETQHLMLRLGISARVRTRTRKLQTARQGEIYRSFDVEATDEHQVSKIAKLPGLCARKATAIANARGRLFESHLRADRVVSVTPSGTKRCRCLTVEDDASFTAGDLAVHNSLMVSVSWQAWTWAQSDISALAGPHVKFANVAYHPKLSERDAIKTKRLIRSPWYRDRWGDRFEVMTDKDTNRMFELSAGGFRFSTSVGGEFTGEGADIITVDDPINAKKANWESARESVNEWWDETVPTRLNDQQTGAKVLIMQRLHEEDLVGHILDKEDEDYVVLSLPMEFDPSLDTRTWINGWSDPLFEDPRKEAGDLLWPERFPRPVVDRLKVELGPFAASAQLQQRPTPKGGGIIEREWWQLWPAPGFEPKEGEPLRYPPCSLLIGSVDTAFGEKETSAWNAMTVWGVWENQRRRPNVVMMSAWRARLKLMGVSPTDEPLISPGGEDTDPNWGLVERVLHTIRRRKLDIVLIENKTRGKDLSDELMRLLRPGECQVLLVDTPGDKVARMNAVQPMFAGKLVWAPNMAWAETVMTEVSRFPKSKWKDYADTVSQALKFLRDQGALKLGPEADADNYAQDVFKGKRPPVYDV